MSTLVSDGTFASPTMEVVNKLQSKFLSESMNNEDIISQNQIYQALNHRPTEEQVIKITSKTLAKDINSLKNATAPGLEGIRPEHWKKLIRPIKSITNIAEQILEILAKFISFIANNEEPIIIQKWITATKIIALNKPNSNNDVRPICIGSVYLKLAAKPILRALQRRITNELKPDQYSHREGGSKIVNKVMSTIFQETQNDIVTIDAQGAFDRISRKQVLVRVKEKFPELLPLVIKRYGNNSLMTYFGAKEGIQLIHSAEGVQQGDVLATLLFSLAINPLLKRLKEVLGNDFAKWFVDDGNLATNFDRMIQVLELLIQIGPSYGYTLNLKKCVYLLDRCDTNEEAIRRKNIIINLGFDPNNIRIHSDNGGLEIDYGVKILGSFIGSKQYIQKGLQSKVEEFKNIAEKLIKYPDSHTKYLLLIKCFKPIPNYLISSQRPSDVYPLCAEFQLLLKKILTNIISTNDNYILPDSAYFQAQLSSKVGGLGLGNAFAVLHAACLASTLACMDELATVIPDLNQQLLLDNTSNISFVKDFQESYRILKEVNDQINIFTLGNTYGEKVQKTIYVALIKKVSDDFKNSIKDDPHKISFFSCLESQPMNNILNHVPLGLFEKLNNSEIQITFLLLLLQPQLSITSSRCICKERPLLKNFKGTLHLAHNCKHGGQGISIHNDICKAIVDFLKYYGINIKNAPGPGDYRLVDPNTNMAGDMLIDSPNPWFHAQVVTGDVTYRDCTTNSNLTVHNAVNNHIKVAKRAVNEKENKYGHFHNHEQLKNTNKFQSLVFLMPCYIEKGTQQFLDKAFSYIGEQQQIPAANIRSFFLRKLQFLVCRKLSAAIINNNCKVQNKYSNPMRNVEFNKYNIMDSTTNEYNCYQCNIDFSENTNNISQNIPLSQISSITSSSFNNNLQSSSHILSSNRSNLYRNININIRQE